MVRSGKVGQVKINPASMTKAASVGYAPQYVEELATSVELGYITDPVEVGATPHTPGKLIPKLTMMGYQTNGRKHMA